MKTAIPIHWRSFSLVKQGHGADEYEDAAAADGARGRFAVADGASESSFAALWAGLLAREFVRAPLGRRRRWAAWLPPLRARWAKELDGRALPWYAEEKLRVGAFATFLGLVVRPSRWRAVAVGDSCLFHLREGRLLRAFPLSRSDEFGNTPRLVGSRAPEPDAIEHQQLRAQGHCRADDRFLLATDALAQWFLRQVEGGNEPWPAVNRLLEPPADDAVFASWIDKLRESEGLRNDDVTLLVLDLSPEPPPTGGKTP